VLGYLILGETLQFQNAIGAVLVIIGVLTLSVDKSFHFRKLKLRLLALMLLCTFILALSSVIFKFFAVQGDFWGTTFWTYVGEALFGLGILAIPKYFKQFVLLLHKNTVPLLGVNAANELINLGGGLGVRFASLFVPVAIVSAISSTTTLFVFIFGILLTVILPRFAHEDISRRSLLQKGIAAVLVAIGVILINV
jgi:drug/metabolite transporter (DMT)-like permease